MKIIVDSLSVVLAASKYFCGWLFVMIKKINVDQLQPK